MPSLILTPSVELDRLVLIGGGEFSFGETRAIDEYLIASMPSGNRKVAFLPTASGSAEYGGHFGSYLRQIDPAIVLSNVPIYRSRDARRQKNLDTVLGAGLVYLGGGVTNQLLGTIHGTPADMAIREAASRGAVVAAIGAAASAFGRRTRNMRSGGAPLEGLSWIANAAIESAFETDHDDALRRLMSVPEIDIGIGIPPRTALVVRGDGSTEIVGDAAITVFRKGQETPSR
jgi:cyanophycinase-like exopeptidase